jgi:hypothetical protein
VALRRDTIGRLLTILGVVAAVVVPLLLLLTWGHTELSVYRSAASYAVIRTTRSFDGGDLASSFRLKLLCLSGAVVLLGALSMIRPAHHRVIGLLAGLAMTAQVVVIAIELNSSDLSHAAFQNPNVDNFVAQFSSPVYVAAFVASGGGALIWLALAALSTNHKVCHDCAFPRTNIPRPQMGVLRPLLELEGGQLTESQTTLAKRRCPRRCWRG